jgi:hypothetical protein
MRFFGVSAFYYTFFFFEVPMTEQGLDALQSTAQQVCSGSWEEMKKKYPSQKQDYLKEYCFAAAYDFTVLSSYGFSSSPTSPPLSIISDRLNNQVVDWSEGLVISRYLKNMKWTNTPGPLSVSY